YKKVFAHDIGPNTGGMGTYAPNFQADRYTEEIKEQVLEPFMKGIRAEGLDFRGILFVGLMIGPSGIKVLEFNTRFGDPETQSVLQLLESDLLEIMQKTSEGKLREVELKVSNKKAVTVVLASGGYPGSYATGHEIQGLEDAGSLVFHAGTKLDGDRVLTSGGRVLSITDVGDTYEQANAKVMETLSKIHFRDAFYRYDIAPLVDRIYVEKKKDFDIYSNKTRSILKSELGRSFDHLRSFIRYDVQGLSAAELQKVLHTVFSEPPIDHVYVGQDALDLEKQLICPIVVQYHKGQFDQREQGVIDTIASALEKEILVNCAHVVSLEEKVDVQELGKIKSLLINPVDQEEGELLGIPSRIDDSFEDNKVNRILDGFITLSEEGLKSFLDEMSLSMNLDDIKLVQDHFVEKRRDPSETEIRMLDTYWSDHCRHTTFNTILEKIEFEESELPISRKIRQSFENYLKERESIGHTKPITLMDMATIVARGMSKRGELADLEVSEENNACSIRVDVEIEKYDGSIVQEPYLVMFKNETHNHPTEIEPFGGASTCIGGAIRDPLSGRAYVYQAMRITGSADPRVGKTERIEGKLSQRKITTEALKGYSSYGNQIGLATGFVDEVYHPGYVAKRMEVGAVIAAAPEKNVVRRSPEAGDAVILIGGRTGRDGIGGATGSSKAHDEKSVKRSSAEVQKGNAPMERKIQRLFRNEKVSTLIKKCNDFGAGGVSVAIGELSDSIEIRLDKVPLKYQGLSPMEIAISESQERMAVVIASKDIERFIALCDEENLEATHVADITDSGKLIMKYKDEVIVDLDRSFIDSSGALRRRNVLVPQSRPLEGQKTLTLDHVYEFAGDINIASRKNMIENFDSSIGGATVLAPLGGKNQITPSYAMVSEIPSMIGHSKQVSLMSYGFDPHLSEQDPYLGAYYAVVGSLCRLAAHGADPLKARLSMQEYFEKLGTDEKTWAKPFVAMLGAYEVTSALKTPPIGGKDSMSGTYKDLNVPPTLISFAVATAKKSEIISSELKGEGLLYLLQTKKQPDGTLDLDELKQNFALLRQAMSEGKILSCAPILHKGALMTSIEMSFGNDISVEVDLDEKELFSPDHGSFVIESRAALDFGQEIGKSRSLEKTQTVVNGTQLDYDRLKDIYLTALDEVFPGEIASEIKQQPPADRKADFPRSQKPVDRPKVVIPVSPGTNCEWDMERSFIKAGAQTEIIVFNNRSIDAIARSVERLAKAIEGAQILALPGGFSLGDEPDGSGKFIASLLRNEKIKAAIEYMLDQNDGLIIGICNGFQALIKTGLLPSGKISVMKENSPTLTYNNNGRHIARMVSTKVGNNNSPWLRYADPQAVYKVPISHGEGRFVCSEAVYEELKKNGQIAFTYLDDPNGSSYNIEGITSPCGKILGKMAHSERVIDGLYQNIPDILDSKLFQAGVDHFKK
ncbi:MAG: phosphoribosylformylglycinamidine synthase, partial [Peptostreptococcaceae bacterium]|nr:phosphoribosylformylglycinamidine synthase [Peptostreptococcaceae bacterium]